MGPEIIIPIAGMCTGIVIVTMALRHAERKARIRAGGLDAGGDVQRLTSIVETMHQESEKLRERVAVLEKLVTDDDRKLATEIEHLRRNESRPA
jgi:hypothetical protein